jgi:hypothetical protein
MELAERAKAIADKARTDREAAAKANRERYPEFADYVDELRRVFGPGCRVIRVVPDVLGDANG